MVTPGMYTSNEIYMLPQVSWVDGRPYSRFARQTGWPFGSHHSWEEATIAMTLEFKLQALSLLPSSAILKKERHFIHKVQDMLANEIEYLFPLTEVMMSR